MGDIFINGNLSELLVRKAGLKQDIYQKTCEAFRFFGEAIRSVVEENLPKVKPAPVAIPLEYHERHEFETELKFAGDILIFMMHTNVFAFNRDHEVMRTSYIKEDPLRSYVGIINIYNFLADSFKYNRINDLGYLIGRVFINCENHYFIEGKREVGLLYNNFSSAVMDQAAARMIVESAMNYTLNFDLLTPPYDTAKEVSVADMQATLDNMKLKTAKRLGFRFQADHDEP